MKILVTGGAGPRGRSLAAHLAREGHDVVAIDTERVPDAPPVRFERIDLRKRGFDDLVRRERFDAVCHLAIHAGFRLPAPVRHRLNLDGSKKVIDVCAQHGVRKLVVASHAAVYGALPDNPCFMTEEAPPSVGRSFPEMQDVVTADLLAGAAMWQHPDLEIVVLRVVHALGPTSRDVLAQLLRRRWLPTVLGYDPMIQVIHEDDLTRAFAAALAPGLRGVFNVTGPGEVPLSVLAQNAGVRRVPLPETFARAALGQFGLPDIGPGALDFLKYPCLVDGARFADKAHFAPAKDLVATVHAMSAA